MHQVKNNSKLSACMALVRNNLSEENQSVKLIIQAGKFDKSKTFDKIGLMRALVEISLHIKTP